ncbi:MAG TPA: tRNA glutamyl-Q(34) synthetase GluQRS [Acidocella sp.]|jgi:glutamyl-Q tRNA(Asp) synthetase|nr:tRNA glutamyl-Q(34) synthetase GluQRS [Acidocella sp.]
MSITSRFAPSPTGFLHLGHAFSAWTAWARADRFWLRLEDIDTSRCRPEFCAGILEDLAWLGLDWEPEVRAQSEHFAEYGAALGRLEQRGLLYPCFCSRAEILRAQAAPHGADPVYPGTCRHLPAAERAAKIAAGAPYALRLDMAEALRQAGPARRFFDEAHGWTTAVPEAFGDVILARRDVPTSYHLCVVHDDALQGVTHVIRGEDLRAVTHLHVLLQALLDLPTPAYAHHRLLTDAAGKRLAKRDQAATLRALRAAGADPQDILRGFEEGLKR